jgi:hypothetical protein
MRTKTLLCMAALAAGVATSMAQNVYSLNIVGYYNVPTPYQLNVISCQLTAGTPSNRADQILPYSDTDNIQIWNGTSWSSYTMDSGSSTGWTGPNGLDIALTGLPVLSPGIGFLYGKNSSITNITIVGQVPTGTNSYTFGSGLQAISSLDPYAGLVRTTNASNFVGCPLPLYSNVQFWNGSKWNVYTYDDGSSTFWYGPTGAEVAEPSVSVGQGFFMGNNSGGSITWTQVLNP